MENRRDAPPFSQRLANLATSLKKPLENAPVTPWTSRKLVLFRFIFLFFVFFIIPLDPGFYRKLFSIDWPSLHFFHLLTLTRYQPEFFALTTPDGAPVPGIAAFSNWALVAAPAAVGTLVWSLNDARKVPHDKHYPAQYTALYHWLRVLIRYRLALALLGYGFYQLFNLQLPPPSLSNLLTHYGNLYAWKVYFQTTAISPAYGSFLGFVEILAAMLILNRRTVTFGAGLVIGFLGNVAVANGFYDIGELSFSAFIVLMAVFLFADDVPRLYALLIRETRAQATRQVPDYSAARWKTIRLSARLAVSGVALLLGLTAYRSRSDGYFKFPVTPGLTNTFGQYQVTEFIRNRDTLAYSPDNPARWQDVVFEKWSTLSIKVNRPLRIDKTSGETLHTRDLDRNYELAGHAGRHYFHYEADTLRHLLHLQNKNRYHRSERMTLSYTRPDSTTIRLRGTDENRDSIQVVLRKINRKYMMYEGRRKAARL